MPTATLIRGFDRTLRWFAPAGNLGDALILSGLLRERHRKTGERFGVVRARPYSSVFIGHPAIAQIASVDSAQIPLQRTDYWNVPYSGKRAGLRPWAKLSLLLFGEVLEEGTPWAPLGPSDHAPLRALSFSRAPVLLAPDADSPRSAWPPGHWQVLTAGLRERTGAPIVTVALRRHATIPGAVDLCGRLPIRTVLALVSRAELVISVDPFVTQGAACFGTPALGLFGATSAALHGDPEQIALEHTAQCASPCLDFDRGGRAQACRERRHCMAEISPEQVLLALEPKLGLLKADRALFEA